MSGFTLAASPPRARAPLGIWAVLRAAWRRRGLIVAVTLLLTALDLAVAAMLPKTYRAEVLLQVDQRAAGRAIEGNMPAVAPDLDGGALAGQADIIRSPALVRRVIEDEELMGAPEFERALREGQGAAAFREAVSDALVWLRALLAPLTRNFPQWQGAAAEAGATADFQTRRREEAAVAHLLSRLRVDYDLRGASMRIRYLSEDPVFAARVANAVAAAYAEQQTRRKVEALRSAGDWLDARLERLRAEALEAEGELAVFRERHRLGSSQAPASVRQQLADLNAQLVAAIGQQAQAEARAGAAEAAARAKRLGDLPEVLASPAMRPLREQEAQLSRRVAELYHGGNLRTAADARAELNALRARIAEEQERVRGSLARDAEVSRARRASIEEVISRVTAGAENRESFAIQAAVLEREATARRTAFEAAVRRAEETRTLDGLRRADVVVVSEARPPVTPFQPRLALVGIFGGLSSLLIGTALAIGIEFRRRPIRSVAEGAAALGIPGLGWLPMLRRPPRWAARGAAASSPPSAASLSYAARLRAIGASMDILFPRRRGLVLVTSALRGEGRTSLAIAYARSVVEEGRSCLLVEADLRNPTIGAKLSPRDDAAGRPGLTEVAAGRARLRDAVRIEEGSGLAFLPVPGPVAEPLSVLDSRAFAHLLALAKQEHDVVVVDAPPALLGPDAAVLAKRADLTVLAVAWSSTSARLAAEAVDRLRPCATGRLAFVLTGVNPLHVPAEEEQPRRAGARPEPSMGPQHAGVRLLAFVR